MDYNQSSPVQAKMKENSSSDNQNIKSTKRLQFLELQIESRNDIENIGKIDIMEQYKPEFSWELYNSEISEQAENQQNTINQENSPEKIDHTKRQDNKEQNNTEQLNISKDSKRSQPEQKQETTKKIEGKNYYSFNKVTERQCQILYNKQLSNIIYLKTQVQQLLRLTAFSIYLDEEQELRQKIYKLNAHIRKIKIRSISKKRIEKQVRQEDKIKKSSKVQQLAEAIRAMKLKSSKLDTKLILLDNYLRVKQRKPSRSRQLHRRSSSSHSIEFIQSPRASCQDIEEKSSYKLKKGSQKYLSENENSYLMQDIKESYFPRRTFKQAKQQSCQINLLEQHMKIIKQNVTEQKTYTIKKIQLLEKQKINLKSQIQFVKFDILRLQNQNRRFRAVSGNTLRKMSNSSTKRGVRSLSGQKLLRASRLNNRKSRQKDESHEKPKIEENYIKLSSKNKLKTQPTRSQASQYPESRYKNTFFEAQSNVLSQNSVKYGGSTKMIQSKNHQNEEIMKEYFNI